MGFYFLFIFPLSQRHPSVKDKWSFSGLGMVFLTNLAIMS